MLQKADTGGNKNSVHSVDRFCTNHIDSATCLGIEHLFNTAIDGITTARRQQSSIPRPNEINMSNVAMVNPADICLETNTIALASSMTWPVSWLLVWRAPLTAACSCSDSRRHCSGLQSKKSHTHKAQCGAWQSN